MISPQTFIRVLYTVCLMAFLYVVTKGLTQSLSPVHLIIFSMPVCIETAMRFFFGGANPEDLANGHRDTQYWVEKEKQRLEGLNKKDSQFGCRFKLI